ncbi:hypothetical protein [Bifidobacterium felsineum]|uniref:hypothetical protein n=1 Tax=Bifidobacterium felsineum TaxID=2045440 RepID=UPI001BDCDFFD|nr:hypothetical protein [Bifidobacterium felsineum]MBT1164603.1 hypothetical protein [Bifidobacterium felsineum]
MTSRMLAVRFRNHVRKIDPTIEFINLRNVLVNGAKRGCSGFLRNPANGRMVYVNTDVLLIERGHEAYARTVKDEHDTSGGQNRWSTCDDLPQLAVNMLHDQSTTPVLDGGAGVWSIRL